MTAVGVESIVAQSFVCVDIIIIIIIIILSLSPRVTTVLYTMICDLSRGPGQTKPKTNVIRCNIFNNKKESPRDPKRRILC